MEGLLPSFDRYPAIFRTTALPFLLAVLVYHLDRGDVERLFPTDHPYRRSGFYQRRPHFTKLKAALVSGAVGRCSGCQMRATGVSAVASCLLQLAELKTYIVGYKAEFDAVKGQIEGMKNMMRTELPGEISAVLNDSLRRNFDFGMASINRDDVVGMLGSMEQRLKDYLSTILPVATSSAQLLLASPTVVDGLSSAAAAAAAGRAQWWEPYVGVSRNVVVAGHLPLRAAFQLFYFGARRDTPPIIPWCLLRGGMTRSDCQMNLSRARSVFSILEHAIQLSHPPADLDFTWGPAAADDDVRKALSLLDKVVLFLCDVLRL